VAGRKVELVGDGIKKFLIVAFEANISNQRVGSTRRKFEGDFFFKDMFLEEWVFAKRSRAFTATNEAVTLRVRSPFTRENLDFEVRRVVTLKRNQKQSLTGQS